MRVNTNIPALNTHRMMGISNRHSAKNLEKLSSGKKINRASDDAAGLAISEKMQAQIRGLRMASKNSLDGMSLIQTAEGALNEVHAMLQRMRELSVQAANGSLAKEDRDAVQGEINQLTSQINTIAYSTEFNKLGLLHGNQGPKSNTKEGVMSTGKPARIESAQALNDTITDQLDDKDLMIEINGQRSHINLEGFTGATSTLTKEDLVQRIKDGIEREANVFLNEDKKIIIDTKDAGGEQKIKISGNAAALIFGGEMEKDGIAENLNGFAQGYLFFEEVPQAGSRIWIGDTKVDFYDSNKAPYRGTNLNIDVHGKTVEQVVAELAALKIPKAALSQGNTTAINNMPDPRPTGFPTALDNEKMSQMLRVIAHDKGMQGQKLKLKGTSEGFEVDLQVGANERQSFRMEIGNCRSTALRISSKIPHGNPGVEEASYVQKVNVTADKGTGFEEFAIDVSDEKKASAAITVYDNAIMQVSKERAKMGAIQNRLEKTIANLDNTQENVTAAQSRITDTDMALEMSEFTKLNVMQQAGMAMLSQANQQPQMILKLLNA